MRSTIQLFFTFIFTILFIPFHSDAQDYKLGKLNDKFTADEVAKPYFDKGMLLLHNFEYEQAIQEFEMAQLLSPNLVMAYWGEAMCYNKPIWFEQDFEKGQTALYKLAVKNEFRVEKAQTELEKGFMNAIDILYSDEPDLKVRNVGYETAMAELYAKHPESEEAAAFYALSILGNCYTGEEDEKISQATRVLMKLNVKNPEHPGALNYMIQIYDDPAKAYKGKKAAAALFDLAKDSKYGQHIPSHIFLANGEWDKVVQCNESAWKLAEAWVRKKKKKLEDRNYHSLWWLQYGYLQQGKYTKALELLTNMNRDARYSKSERMRFHLAMMRGHYLMETGKWLHDASGIQIPTNGFSVSTKNMCFFVDAMTALGKHDVSKVDWYLNQMTDQRMIESDKKGAYKDFRICHTVPLQKTDGLDQELMLAEILEWEIQALKALKLNKIDEAEGFIKKAIALEDNTKYQPGPPVVLKPAHEIYGEILLAKNNSTEAVKQFDLALQKYPNRSLSLLGKYKALKNLGDMQKATQIKELLMVNWQNADEQARAKLE